MTALVVRVVGPTPAPDGLTVVLLHGFGAPGDDLVALTGAVEAPAGTQFVFPEAPLALPIMYGDARAWWMLDLERIERALAGRPDDRSDEIPVGLAEARGAVDQLLGELIAGGARRIVLGGFSQGAMLSLDTALHTAHPIAGLALMSGTRINAAAWRARWGKLRGMPVLQSHGRSDSLLPFRVAESLRDELRGADAEVDWIEFGGGHEIPPSVLAGLDRLLTRVASRSLAG